MNKDDIRIRPAVKSDAQIIAKIVAMAIGDEATLYNYCGNEYISVLTEIANTENTQYSWQNAIIAEYKGEIAGAIVGYDGALLETLREKTFAIIQKRTGHTPTIANETEPGEYYLDSIAVLPKFQRKGIAKKLIHTFCNNAFMDGHKQVGLIVDIDNPNAEKLYRLIGFKSVGERIFFEHKMKHLQYKTHQKE